MKLFLLLLLYIPYLIAMEKEKIYIRHPFPQELILELDTETPGALWIIENNYRKYADIEIPKTNTQKSFWKIIPKKRGRILLQFALYHYASTESIDNKVFEIAFT